MCFLPKTLLPLKAFANMLRQLRRTSSVVADAACGRALSPIFLGPEETPLPSLPLSDLPSFSFLSFLSPFSGTNFFQVLMSDFA